MMTKAMVLHACAPVAEDGPLIGHTDWPEPMPGRGEIRIRVHCCAVCRTDLHVVEGDLPKPPNLPIIPGHQTVGTIDRIGPGVDESDFVQFGRRIGIAWLRGTCGSCAFCGSGRENLCRGSRYTGYHEHGGYAKYAVVPAGFAYPIPDLFSDVEAAPLLCAGIIGFRALHRANVRSGGKVALFGFGSSAHIAIQIALYRGCEVYVVTRAEQRQNLAREMGAVWAGASASDLPGKMDSAILFAPVGTLVPDALAALERGGTLAIAGIHLTDTPPLDYQRHLFYERDLRTVTANTRDDARSLLAEAAAIPIRPRTAAYPLEQANRALADLKHGRVDGTAVLIVGDPA